MPTLPDVNIDILDGGLGLVSSSATGVHAKVGVCSAGTANQIVGVSDPSKIKDLFGTGPLANALGDSFQAGSSVMYAVRAAGDIAGVTGTVTFTKTGTGSMTVSGSPLDNYQVQVKIEDQGKINVASFRYSLDGGDNWSGKLTVQASYAIPDTGITLNFSEDAVTPENSFKTGDLYSFNTTAPKASVSSIQAAVQALLDSAYKFEFVHVVGEADAAVWTALASLATTAETKFRYIHFLAEAAGPGATDTVDDWVNARVTEAQSFASTRVSVCAARAEVIDLLTGRQVDRNLAGIYAGWVSACKIQKSPGEVALGAVPGIVRLLPAGLNDAHILALDQARYVTFRQYIGEAGFYVTNGRMMAPETSDFRYVELRRAMDKACGQVRTAALRREHGEATEAGIEALEGDLTAPLDIMIGAGEITDGRVIIPKDQDVIATSTLQIKVRIVPVPIMRWIEVEIGFENPYQS